MARIGSLRLAQRATVGATLVILDYLADVQADGTLPPMRAADGSPATITVQGMDSPTAQRFQHRRAAETQNRAYASFAAKKDAPSVLVTADDVAEIEQAEIELLTELTSDWHGFEDDTDTAIPFSADAVRDLYATCVPIRNQVLAFVRDRTRFFGSSATPSKRSLTISSGSDTATTG